MRKTTVKTGLTVITAGIAVVTVVTFCHELLAGFFLLSPASEMRLVAIGLFWGALIGGLGGFITVTGLFRSAGGREVRLLPALLFLALAVILFWILFFTSVEHPRQPRLRPGETITI